MATRNFVFRKSPRNGERGARFVLGGPTQLTTGVPVLIDGSNDGLGRLTVTLATGDQAKPKVGTGGILVFENIEAVGFDGRTITFSDVDLATPGDAVQVVTGGNGRVKAAFINTPIGASYVGRANYPKARIMVAGVSQATPSVAVGDYLTPGDGNDAAGYWKETSTAANGWWVVTSVDSTNGVVEAELNF
jgi:hypothetical protein